MPKRYFNLYYLKCSIFNKNTKNLKIGLNGDFLKSDKNEISYQLGASSLNLQFLIFLQ